MKVASLEKKVRVLKENKVLWRRYNRYVEGANLRFANLSGADLSDANLRDANLRFANLSGADLSDANLRDANLHNANLHSADLSDANLCNANLYFANLSGANLRFANLHGADLRGANLSGANLRFADLSDIHYSHFTAFFALQCPEEGSFIAYKKAQGCIIKLLIPEDAKRSSATSRKCRASKAKVLEIVDKNGKNVSSIVSDWDSTFIYEVGKTVDVEDFDEDRWNECSTGIHFFITREEAEQW